MILVMVENLVIKKESENRRCSRLVVFDLLVSRRLCTPHRIETMMHKLVESMAIQFYTSDGLHKVI